jgi:hypothetical protein
MRKNKTSLKLIASKKTTSNASKIRKDYGMIKSLKLGKIMKFE